MKTRYWLALILIVLASVPLQGCARAARDTRGFAIANSVTVERGFEETWQAAKAILREQELEIYTRDKRGTFVAYTPMKRHLLVAPHRTQYTISLESLSDQSTRVTIESVRQVYGVTMFTYPGWHDRKTTDSTEAVAILEALQTKTAGA